MAISPIGSYTPLFVFRQLNLHTAAIGRATERLSSGLRINRAADDPAGISMAARFLAQLGGITSAETNVQLGISMVQTAEGGLTAIKESVVSIEELAVEAQNGTLTIDDLEAISDALEQLQSSISDVVSTTTFNTKQLLQGDSVTIQSGPQGEQTITLEFPDLDTADNPDISALDSAIVAFQTAVTMGNLPLAQTKAGELETAAEDAFTEVLGQITRQGGVESRLAASFGALSAMEEGTANALSRIRDADVAAEAVELAKQRLLQEASIDLLAKLNTQSALWLKLLE